MKLNITNIRSILFNFKDRWGRLVAESPEWLRQHRTATGAVYAFPVAAVDDVCRIFGPAALRGLEIEFCRLCHDYHAIGIREGLAIHYSHLRPQIPIQHVSRDLQLRLAWTDDELAEAKKSDLRSCEVLDRVNGAAGRIVSIPAYWHDVDELRTLWESMPVDERLPFPLRRAATNFDPPIVRFDDFKYSQASDKLVAFVRRLTKFLDRWELQSLVDWHLPVPRTPFWPDYMYSTKPGGDSATYTPFHFPLLVSDNVGESVLSLHAAQSQAHGIDDHDSHQTYAQFIRMNHWELVLKQRFDDGRPRGGFASKRDEALTVLLDCSMEHVKRLRSWWLGLLNGRRISLKKELETHKTNRIHTRLGRGDQEALIV